MEAKKYILIGIPNSGKSTLGRRAADKLRIPFYDTDDMACEKVENPLHLFRMALNGQFHKEQLKAISKLAKLKDGAIISTGAEAAMAPECAAILKTMGTIIHIQRNPDILLEEFKKRGKHGLFTTKKDGTKVYMQEEAIKCYAQECSQYEALADLTLENNGTEEEGLEKLLKMLDS